MSTNALPGCVSDMAFTAPGDEIWIAKRNYGIEVRSWPGFELQRVIPVFGFFLAAHPTDPYMAVLSAGGVSLLDLEGNLLRTWSFSGGYLLAVAFLEDALQVLVRDRNALCFALWSCSLAGPEVEKIATIEEPKEPVLQVLWAALLPGKKLAFFAIEDREPLLWRIKEGSLNSARDWAPKPKGPYTSWLSVDASSDERFLMWAYQGEQAPVVSLDEKGDIIHDSDRDWFGTRSACQAIHHRDEIAVGITIHGHLFLLPASTKYRGPELWPSIQFSPGYRWDQT